MIREKIKGDDMEEGNWVGIKEGRKGRLGNGKDGEEEEEREEKDKDLRGELTMVSFTFQRNYPSDEEKRGNW